MVEDIEYYEQRLDIIIYLLNSTNDVNVLDYLTEEYAKYYNKYEKLLQGSDRLEESNTLTTMDWI